MPLRILSPIRKARARGGRGKPTQTLLEALNDKYSRVVSIDLQRGLTTFSKRVDYDKMADAVYSGNYKKVFATLPTDLLPADIEASMKRLGISMEDASRIASDSIPFGRDVRERYVLDPSKNEVLADYLSVKSGALIQNIEDSMQGNVQEALRFGLQNKLSPEEIAEKIKQTGLGLNDRQTGALLRLEGQWRANGFQETQIEQMVEDQAARYLAQRCDTIARTEVSQAQNAAQMETWRASDADGLLGDGAEKTWMTEGDACPFCADLSGSTLPLDETWLDTSGDEIDAPPAHPNCKCVISLSKNN